MIPHSAAPNIVVQQGDVEDWTIVEPLARVARVPYPLESAPPKPTSAN